MKEKEIYTELEVDFYPDKESIDTVMQFLESLKLMSRALNRSSDIAIDGGAGFSFQLKINGRPPFRTLGSIILFIYLILVHFSFCLFLPLLTLDAQSSQLVCSNHGYQRV